MLTHRVIWELPPSLATLSAASLVCGTGLDAAMIAEDGLLRMTSESRVGWLRAVSDTIGAPSAFGEVICKVSLFSNQHPDPCHQGVISH